MILEKKTLAKANPIDIKKEKITAQRDSMPNAQTKKSKKHIQGGRKRSFWSKLFSW
jgi:hypothetical protein